MKSIDLNADLGEADNPGWANDEIEMLQYISSANIACGGHAGSDESMSRMILGAQKHNVVIGAHPSYPDREFFGRKSFKIGRDIGAQELKLTLVSQISKLINLAESANERVRYVKPHGALYNDAMKDTEKADIIAGAISSFKQNLIFLGGPNSEMKIAAKKYGLKYVSEGFADRRYTEDGHLQSRNIKGSVIEKQNERISQARNIVLNQSVITASGKKMPIKVDTICLHGDSPGALRTAKKIRNQFEKSGIKIMAFANV